MLSSTVAPVVDTTNLSRTARMDAFLEAREILTGRFFFNKAWKEFIELRVNATGEQDGILENRIFFLKRYEKILKDIENEDDIQSVMDDLNIFCHELLYVDIHFVTSLVKSGPDEVQRYKKDFSEQESLIAIRKKIAPFVDPVQADFFRDFKLSYDESPREQLYFWVKKTDAKPMFNLPAFIEYMQKNYMDVYESLRKKFEEKKHNRKYFSEILSMLDEIFKSEVLTLVEKAKSFEKFEACGKYFRAYKAMREVEFYVTNEDTRKNLSHFLGFLEILKNGILQEESIGIPSDGAPASGTFQKSPDSSFVSCKPPIEQSRVFSETKKPLVHEVSVEKVSQKASPVVQPSIDATKEKLERYRNEVLQKRKEKELEKQKQKQEFQKIKTIGQNSKKEGFILFSVFRRLLKLNSHNLETVENLLMGKTNIAYQKIENLLNGQTHSLGSMIPNTGSHRRFRLPALEPLIEAWMEKDFVSSFTCGEQGFFQDINDVVPGVTYRPHGGQHSSSLPPQAVRMIQATLEQAGITLQNFQVFQQTKAVLQQDSTKDLNLCNLWKMYRSNPEACSQPSHKKRLAM